MGENETVARGSVLCIRVLGPGSALALSQRIAMDRRWMAPCKRKYLQAMCIIGFLYFVS